MMRFLVFPCRGGCIFSQIVMPFSDPAKLFPAVLQIVRAGLLQYGEVTEERALYYNEEVQS